MDNIVHGLRKRRPVLIVTAVFCLVATAVLWVALVQDINLYRYQPTSWVLNDLKSANRRLANNAWTELMRRDRDKLLPNRHLRALIELCLQEQALPTTADPERIRRALIDYLGQCYVNRRLTAAEEARFFDQISVLELRVQPLLALGTAVPYEIHHYRRCPSDENVWYRIGVTEIRLDDAIVQAPKYSATSVSVGRGNFEGTIQCREAGLHNLSIRIDLEAFYGPVYDLAQSKLCHQREVLLHAPFLARGDMRRTP